MPVPASPRITAADLRAPNLSQRSVEIYRHGWARWEEFCASQGVPPLAATPETVLDWWAQQLNDGATAWTITARRTAVRHGYRRAGVEDDPTFSVAAKRAWRGTMQLASRRPTRRATPILVEDVLRMIAWTERRYQPKRAARNAAILALGFAAALRGGEYGPLNIGDLVFLEDGRLLLQIRRSKTDQKGDGYNIPIVDGDRVKPVTRVRHLLQFLGDDPSLPLFPMCRGANGIQPRHRMGYIGIRDIVKRTAVRAGLRGGIYTPHSLRAGFVTSAIRAGARIDMVQKVTRHRQIKTLMIYLRDSDAWSAHAGLGML